MLDKLKAFYSLFTKGAAVANAIALKRGQVTAGMVSALLAAMVAVARIFGADLHVTDDQLLQIGGAVVIMLGLFNSGATVASTDKIGLPPLRDRTGESDKPSESNLPAVPTAVQDKLPSDRRAANGDDIAGNTPASRIQNPNLE